MYTARKGGEL